MPGSLEENSEDMQKGSHGFSEPALQNHRAWPRLVLPVSWCSITAVEQLFSSPQSDTQAMPGSCSWKAGVTGPLTKAALVPLHCGQPLFTVLLLVPHIPKFLPFHPHPQQGHVPPIPNLSVFCVFVARGCGTRWVVSSVGAAGIPLSRAWHYGHSIRQEPSVALPSKGMLCGWRNSVAISTAG